ncbi:MULTISPECIES: hypothetical protein [unclassified Nocardioides]|uniref:hypothetical protein n=1 Tax=unclassified Nocardioides TaxID=2615069 RepID=UPI0006F988C3|nr:MULTISPECIES: hypothetical protein [unclassified Nocardioides]KQY55565.1 hypothetical protein ASD30_16890 [Nocardioides sp. Root140]KQZ67223.1 hypothetical protein ASD66_19820 [Nocardioides sp. Root151]KRF12698.1 hypothetical protein ASH02_14235 [Nocardioides sp. Soil796]
MGRASESALLLDTARAIWPDAVRIDLTRAMRADPGQRLYAVLPHVRSPHWLLPTDAPSTAVALGAGESRGLTSAGRRLLALAHTSGLTRLVPVPRLRVEPGEAESLITVLEGVVGRETGIAIRIGNWTHARSFVVRVLDRRGTTVAFGKVGIDAHGRAAVHAESAALERVSRFGLQEVVLPGLLHQGSWHGLEMLLVSPLVAPARSSSGVGMPLTAMAELAHADSPRVDRLADSRWMDSVRQRVGEVDDAGRRSRLGASLHTLEARAGDVSLPLGCWHGDWTAWNMAWDGGRVLLWDWEHFAEDVPVGFDQIHYLAQQLRVESGVGRAEEQAWQAQAAALLSGEIGLGRAQADAVAVAYLLEVNLRFVLDRQATPASATERSGWGLDLLARATEALPVP